MLKKEEEPSETKEDEYEKKTSLKEAGIDVSSRAGSWPREGDIFDGTFSTIDPRKNKGVKEGVDGSDSNEDGEKVEKTEEHPTSPSKPSLSLAIYSDVLPPSASSSGKSQWKCVMCLNENLTTSIKCGVCERVRPCHGKR